MSVRLSVVLVRTRNPLNIGAVARAMSNFGVTDLRLVQPYEPSFREAKSAVGAAAVLASATVCEGVLEAIADCNFVVGTTAGNHRELSQPLLALDHAGPELQRELARGRVALLFGSEKTGLSTAHLSHCHRVLRIPTRGEHGSMNLGQAVAVCLYELVRSASANITAVHSQPARATAADLSRLETVFYEALRAAGYIKPNTESSTADDIRQLLRRLAPTASDATLMTGMVRKMREALLRKRE